MNQFKNIFSLTIVSLLVSSCGPKMYESYLGARNACQKWAVKGETIHIANTYAVNTFLDPTKHYKNTFKTDSIASNGNPIVAEFFEIRLRTCKFDYDTNAYIGYQHKGIDRISDNDFPKPIVGTYWVDRKGKRLKLFKSWDVKGGEKVKSYKF